MRCSDQLLLSYRLWIEGNLKSGSKIRELINTFLENSLLHTISIVPSGVFFSDLNFLKIYIKILSPVLQSMIRQSLLEPFCRFFFFYNSTRNFSSRERLFQIISNVRYLAVCKKKKKTGIFWKHGEKMKTNPP